MHLTHVDTLHVPHHHRHQALVLSSSKWTFCWDHQGCACDAKPRSWSLPEAAYLADCPFDMPAGQKPLVIRYQSGTATQPSGSATAEGGDASAAVLQSRGSLGAANPSEPAKAPTSRTARYAAHRNPSCLDMLRGQGCLCHSGSSLRQEYLSCLSVSAACAPAWVLVKVIRRHLLAMTCYAIYAGASGTPL